MTRYIFVTGGVSSSLGKGIAGSSLAALLQARGYSVRARKFEPYLNVDPGTMNPFQHGEVFVTEDGAETDLDLGHYERYTGVNTRSTDAISTGRIYLYVLRRERKGDYLGATIQVIPHITDAIQEAITDDIEPDLDFLICEIGGTVGDIESLPFLEAIRQFAYDVGRENALFLHLTLLPYISSAGELKTKPTQHSVKELLRQGIQSDILLCRTEYDIPDNARHKLALFCNTSFDRVIPAKNAHSIYQVPLNYYEAGLDTEVCKYFNVPTDKKPDLSRWQDIMDKIDNTDGTVNVAIVGKYTDLKDAYKSLDEAIVHGGLDNRLRPEIHWINSERIENEESIADVLKGIDGIIIPGGYGTRGIQGKLRVIEYARTHHIPMLGICLGMQLMTIEYARNVLGLKDADSSEFNKTETSIVGLLTEWEKEGKTEQRAEDSDLGGTMRLGAYDCRLKPGSLAHSVYQSDIISERHRHRYEVNMAYKEKLEENGLVFTGLSPDGLLPEIVECKDHPWYLGVQFHPELKSRPFAPHPIFSAFVKAAFNHSK